MTLTLVDSSVLWRITSAPRRPSSAPYRRRNAFAARHDATPVSERTGRLGLIFHRYAALPSHTPSDLILSLWLGVKSSPALHSLAITTYGPIKMNAISKCLHNTCILARLL